MDNLGNGLSLDEELDFHLTPSGDLATDSGMEELNKDLTVVTIVELNEFLGAAPSSTIAEEVLAKAVSVIEPDDRVDYVDKEKSEVSFSNNRQSIELDLAIYVNDAEYNLVIEV